MIYVPEPAPHIAPSNGVQSRPTRLFQQSLRYSHIGICISPNGMSLRTVLPYPRYSVRSASLWVSWRRACFLCFITSTGTLTKQAIYKRQIMESIKQLFPFSYSCTYRFTHTRSCHVNKRMILHGKQRLSEFLESLVSHKKQGSWKKSYTGWRILRERKIRLFNGKDFSFVTKITGWRRSYDNWCNTLVHFFKTTGLYKSMLALESSLESVKRKKYYIAYETSSCARLRKKNKNCHTFWQKNIGEYKMMNWRW